MSKEEQYGAYDPAEPTGSQEEASTSPEKATVSDTQAAPQAAEQPQPEAPQTPKKKGKKTKMKYPFWKRLLIFLLGMLIGLIACIGAIGGAGAWLYMNGSLGMFGVQLESNGGEVDLDSLTVAELVNEVIGLTSNPDNLTLAQLQKRYGLKMVDDVAAILPGGVLTIPLTSLGNEDGMNQLMAAIDFNYIFGFVGEGAISEPLKDALGDKTLDSLMGGDYTAVFGDVKLGYFLPLDYVKQGDEWVLKPGSNDDMMGIVADVKLGALLDGSADFGSMLDGMMVGELLGYSGGVNNWRDEHGNPISGVDEVLANIDIGALMSGSADFDSMMDGLLVGDLMGYSGTLNKWTDQNGDPVKGVNQELANVDLGDLMSGNLDVESIMGDLYVGDLMGFDGSVGRWTENGEPVTGINKYLSDEKISDLMSNGFDISIIGDMKFGDLLNYDKYDSAWYDHGKPLTGLHASVADVTINEMLADDFSINTIIGNVYLGEIMGYTPVYKSDNKTIDYWKTESGEKVTGINADVANMGAGSLTDGDFDFKDAFGHSYIGDLQNATKRGNTWYGSDGKPFEALENAIADLNVGDLIDGNVNLVDKLDTVYIGEIMGYQGSVGAWTDGGRAVTGLRATIADIKMGDIEDEDLLIESLSSAKIGEVLGLHKSGNDWYDENGKVGSLLNLIAGEQIGNLQTAVDSWYLGNLMGYTKSGDVWKQNGANVTGMMAVIADLQLNQISNGNTVRDAIQQMQIADVMGYTKTGSDWYHNGNKVDGILAAIAGTTVGNLDSRIDTLTMAEVLGYTKSGSDWYHNGNKVDGILAAIADSTVSELSNRVDDLKMSDVYENTDSGFFSLIGGSTKITELGNKLEEIFDPATGATMGDFLEAGLLNISTTQQGKLNILLPSWKTLTVTGFIEQLINLIP